MDNSIQSIKQLIKTVDLYEQLEWYSQLRNDMDNEANGNKPRLYRFHKERGLFHTIHVKGP